MITCEILKGAGHPGEHPCGAVAIGWTIDKFPVCPDCADDDTLQVVKLVEPFPVEYIGDDFNAKHFTPECFSSLVEIVMSELVRARKLVRDSRLGVRNLCSGCKVKPSTGILGLCADCQPEYGYTPEEVERLDKPDASAPVAPLSIADTTAERPPIGVDADERDQVDLMRDGQTVKKDRYFNGGRVEDLPGLYAERLRSERQAADDVNSWYQAAAADRPSGTPLIMSYDLTQEGKILPTTEVLGSASTREDAANEINRQLDLPIAESGPVDLIRQRAADWARRSEKWHRVLDRERKWTARGAAYPTLIGAVVALVVILDALHVLKIPFAQAWPAFATLLVALVGVRANHARVQLEAGKVADAWVSADRMAEHYRGLVAKLDASIPPPYPTGFARVKLPGEDELVREAFAESQKLEASARFGVPKLLQDTLGEVTER